MKQKDGQTARKVGISLIVVISMLISGFAFLTVPGAIAQEAMGGEYGGSLRVALQSEPSSLNPLATPLNASAEQVIDLMYESLGRIDPYSLELKPWMASSWKVNTTDQSLVSVVLRTGMTWHDGTPVTLDDVIYTFGSSGYGISYISAMTKDESTNTVLFNLTQPDSRFFSDVMTMKIVKNGFTAASEPMGCGPFMLVSTDSNSTVLAAFNNHFIARPYLDTITFTYYPYMVADFSAAYPYSANFGNEDPRWDGSYRASYDLIKGKLDFIGWSLSTNQTTAMVEIDGNGTTLVLNVNTTVQRSNGLDSWYLGFNNAPGNMLNDPALRKAITYAIDKVALTQYDISGGLEKTESVISKYNVPWYNSSIAPYSFDMSKATSVLTAAGYMDYNNDGFIDKPGPDPAHPMNGAQNISLTLLGPAQEDVTPYTMSTNIVAWFLDLGLNVTLVSNTTDVHMTDILADNFDMFLADSTGTVDPQFIYDIYYSKATTTNILNFAGTYSVVNESQIKKIDATTKSVHLNYTNIENPVYVYKNGTMLSNASWTLDYDTGLLTLDAAVSLNLQNDTLDVSYNYRPFDHYMDLAGKQMEPADRAVYIKEAQGVISDLCPSVPMFSYKVNHAYYAGSYVGWVQTLGGLANYWTYTGLKNELVGALDVTLSIFKNYMTEGDTADLFIKVQDLNGASIDTAQFAFSGDGTFGTPVYDAIGEQYKVQYTAPSTIASKTITLSVSAYAVGYSQGSDTLDITVHPIINEFNVEIIRQDTALPSGNQTNISVIVTDKSTSQAVNGAAVVLSLSPAGLGGMLSEVTGTTNSAGEFVTVFSSKNVTVDTTFRISVHVTMNGYADVDQTTSISVSRDPNIVGPSSDKGFLGLPAPSFPAILVLLAALSMIYAAYRRKR